MSEELEPLEVTITVDTSGFERAMSAAAERYRVGMGEFERQMRAVQAVINATSDEVAILRSRAFGQSPSTG